MTDYRECEHKGRASQNGCMRCIWNLSRQLADAENALKDREGHHTLIVKMVRFLKGGTENFTLDLIEHLQHCDLCWDIFDGWGDETPGLADLLDDVQSKLSKAGELLYDTADNIQAISSMLDGPRLDATMRDEEHTAAQHLHDRRPPPTPMPSEGRPAPAPERKGLLAWLRFVFWEEKEP